MRALIAAVCVGLCAASPGRSQELVKRINVAEDDVYLNLPVKQSNPLVKARIKLDGVSLDEFTLKLASEDPDYWTFFDVTRYRGKTLTLEVDEAGDGLRDLDLVDAAPTFPGQESVYSERYRPQVTFSSRRGWHNDPNGLIYYNGEYHLFYQHNPYGVEWGNMHWGHAVSTDLVHWRELPDALYSPDHDHMAFSGSAVVDTANTSGLSRNGVDPLLAFYTRTGVGENLAISYDNGLTFEEYPGNPVVSHEGRDPKVIWYEPGKHWVMVVWDEGHTRRSSLGEHVRYQVSFYSSPDLKNWTYESGLPGFFECPELFEIEVEGQPGVTKWVLYDANGDYVVGGFDGRKFTVEQPFRKLDNGGDFYASQMFNNIPESDGRHIQIGWFRNGDYEGMPFSQKMTFPTSLKLRESFDGLRLTPTPIEEIRSLHKKTHVFTGQLVRGDQAFASPVTGDVLHVIAEIDPGDAPTVGLDINGYRLTYDRFLNTFNGLNFVLPEGERLKIEAIVDRVAVEVFVNDGELYFVKRHNSVDADKKLEVFTGGGSNRSAVLETLTVHELESIWQQNVVTSNP
ncbi:MAG TPA: glycoside hydrolase family 32 protein [Longimicrobiaceae bacterium]